MLDKKCGIPIWIGWMNPLNQILYTYDIIYAILQSQNTIQTLRQQTNERNIRHHHISHSLQCNGNLSCRSNSFMSEGNLFKGHCSSGTSYIYSVVLFLSFLTSWLNFRNICDLPRSQAHGAWISFPPPPFFQNFHINHSFFKIFIIIRFFFI